MFNIYDQSNKVTYPDYKTGYWQRQIPLSEVESRDIYTRFTQNFGSDLDTINSWSAKDRLAGLLLDGENLYLIRIHNGGEDDNRRPQRWVLLLWRLADYSAAKQGVVDIVRWLNDPEWPAPRDNTAIPLPRQGETLPQILNARYNVPFISVATATATAIANGAIAGRKSYSDWIFSPKPTEVSDFSDVLLVGETEFFPEQLEAFTLTNKFADVEAALKLWASWTLSTRREKTGFLLFSNIGGNFKIFSDLRLGHSPILDRRKENERLWQEELCRREKAAKEAELQIRTAIEETERRHSEAEQRLNEAEKAEQRFNDAEQPHKDAELRRSEAERRYNEAERLRKEAEETEWRLNGAVEEARRRQIKAIEEGKHWLKEAELRLREADRESKPSLREAVKKAEGQIYEAEQKHRVSVKEAEQKHKVSIKEAKQRIEGAKVAEKWLNETEKAERRLKETAKAEQRRKKTEKVKRLLNEAEAAEHLLSGAVEEAKRLLKETEGAEQQLRETKQRDGEVERLHKEAAKAKQWLKFAEQWIQDAEQWRSGAKQRLEEAEQRLKNVEEAEQRLKEAEEAEQMRREDERREGKARRKARMLRPFIMIRNFFIDIISFPKYPSSDEASSHSLSPDSCPPGKQCKKTKSPKDHSNHRVGPNPKTPKRH